jgi:hypothetical protein
MGAGKVGPDYGGELVAASRRYGADGTVSVVSEETVGSVRHGLRKAVIRAAPLGEEPDIAHHQTFVLRALKTGRPDLVVPFLTSLLGGS